MRTLWPMLLPGLLIPGCTVVTARTLPAPSHASTADMPTAAETLTESVSVPVLQRLEAIPGDTGGTVARWQLVAEAADRAGTPSYHWSASGGLLSATAGTRTWWTPPREAGTHLVQVLVSSSTGGARSGTLTLVIDAEGRSTMGQPVFRIVGEATPSLAAAPPQPIPGRAPTWYRVPHPGQVAMLVPGPARQALAWRREGSGHRIDRTMDGGGSWVAGAWTPRLPVAAGHDSDGWWLRDGSGAAERSGDGLRWATATAPTSDASPGPVRHRLSGRTLERRDASGTWMPLVRIPLEDRFLTLRDVTAVHEGGARTLVVQSGQPVVQDEDSPWRVLPLPAGMSSDHTRFFLGPDGTAWALSDTGTPAVLPPSSR